MSERQLIGLPGYQPIATVDSLDMYLTEKRGIFGDEASTYASGVALQGSGLVMTPDEIEHQAARGREWVIRRQGAAPYVAALARRLVTASSNGAISSQPTEKTGLTTLFRDTYGVDLVPYMEQSTNKLGITGATDRSGANVVGLNYMAIRESHGNIFWQLTVDGEYGFVNMYCVRHDFATLPLEGQGNITLIPGVQEALTADTAFIEENSAL